MRRRRGRIRATAQGNDDDMPNEERTLATESMDGVPQTAVERMTEATLRRIEDRQVEVLQEMARHGKWLESIDVRFAKLNGSVAELSAESIRCQQFRAVHSDTVGRLQEIEHAINEKSVERDKQVAAIELEMERRAFIIAQNTADVKSAIASRDKATEVEQKVNDRWKSVAKPWIDRLLLAIVVIVLWNGRDLLNILWMTVVHK